MSLVGMLYNIQLLKYAEEDGVAAYGVLMYVNMIFIAIFIGYSVGSAPIIGYHYGADNKDELKSILKKSCVIIGICSILMLGFAELLAKPLSLLFVGYDAQLTDLTTRGFVIYSFSFLFAGFAIYGSSFFTALNDGITSAIISFMRTLVFQIAAVLLLPLAFGIDGIWYSIVVAELMAVALVIFFLFLKKKKYEYMSELSIEVQHF
jgi:Na+-driven multidrug efflux pump